MRPDRRLLLAAMALAAATLLGACEGLGGPTKVTVSRGDIERLVAREFPLERRVMDLFDVTVKAPAVNLLPERNRLAAVVDVLARERLLRGQWQGQLSFDAMLRWQGSDQTVRLAQVRVQDFAVDASAATRGAAERLSAAVAERMLEDQVVYRLPAERAQQLASRGLAPEAVTVTARGVEITFTPLAK